MSRPDDLRRLQSAFERPWNSQATELLETAACEIERLGTLLKTIAAENTRLCEQALSDASEIDRLTGLLDGRTMSCSQCNASAEQVERLTARLTEAEQRAAFYKRQAERIEGTLDYLDAASGLLSDARPFVAMAFGASNATRHARAHELGLLRPEQEPRT